MKQALRLLLSTQIIILSIFVGHQTKAQCPVVIDSIVTTDVTCNGAMDGTITIYVSGGFPDYNYQISNGPFFQNVVSSSTSHTFSGLGAGVTDYLVLVIAEDGIGGTCPSPPSAFVTISDPPPFSITVNTTDETCPESSDGTATAVVVGGQPPYTFQWPPFAETDSIITGLDSGTYTVIVTDFNGCSQNQNYTIVGPPDWADTLTGTNITCFGANDGSITASGAVGGTPPYAFSWSPGGMTTENVSGLAPGTYTLTITDDNGCTFSPPSVIISQPSEMVLSETHVDESCGGNEDGSINLTIGGGTPPYSVSWSSGQTTEDLSGLGGGLYVATVTDDNGCISSIPVSVQNGALLSLTTTVVNSECNASTGSIDLEVSGGSGTYSYDWLPGGETTQDLANLSAGVYSVLVTDDVLGCTDSVDVILTDFPGPNITGIVTNGSNCIANDGSIDATITDGSGDYTISWSHGPTTEDVTGLAAGNYTITVTDNISGCIGIAGFVVGEDTEITATASITDAACGLLDGAIDLTVSGPSGPYTFLWSTSDITEDISGLGAGVYLVTITDINGCTLDTSFNVNDLGSPTLSGTETDPSCDGFSNGGVDLSVSGGTPPYSFLWSSGATTEDLTGVSEGSYTVTVTDDNGCQAIMNFTLTAPPALYGTVDVTDVSCNGFSDGAIDVTLFGGVPPYTVTWTPGPVVSEDLINVPADTYLGSGVDDNGCTISALITVSEPPAIVISETHTDIQCDGDDDGSIDITVSGGVPPYSYNWSNGATTEDLSGLSGGLYTVTVTDDNGCVESLPVTIQDGAILSFTTTVVNSECNASTGSIDLSVSGGSGTYSYTWQPGGETSQDLANLGAGVYSVIVTDDVDGCVDSVSAIVTDFPGPNITGVVTNGSNCIANDGSIDVTITDGSGDYTIAWSHGPTTEDVTGLPAGNYSITVTDNISGCIGIAGFTVTDDSEITASATTVDASCGVADGAIDLTVSGPSGPYTFFWSTTDVSEDISGLAAGIYSVTITDVNGCTLDTSFNVNDAGSPSLSGVVTDPSCDGFTNGAVDLTVSGGTPPYAFLWSSGASTEDLSGVSEGSYSVTVTDDNGCVAIMNFTLTAPAPLSGTVDVTDVSCNGLSDGSIDVTLTGGTLPYTITWTPGPVVSEDLINVPADTYLGSGVDGNGCTISALVTIDEPSAINISETHVNIDCNGDNDGSIDITVTGGVGPYSYSWLPNGETSEDLTGLGPGTYTVLVTDSTGCTETLGITITEPSPLVLNPSSTNATCNGICDGTASVAPTGGTPGYTYSWTPNVSSGPSASGLCGGNYMVVVTDAGGCQDSAAFIIQDSQINSVVTSTDVVCGGTCDGTISISTTGPNPPFTYSWSPNVSSDSSATGLCADTYTITITDNTGCSVQEVVVINEPLPITISMAITDVSCEGGSDGAIDLTVSGGTPPYTYTWFPSGQTTQDLNNIPAGTYSVVVTDANGCNSSSITLGGSFDGGTLALPDGTGTSYSTDISINGFQPGQTLTDINDFTGICIEMEHTWFFDLDINLTCPSGQSVDLVQTQGVGTEVFLGDANDNDNITPVPGVGFVYCWDNSPTFGTMEAEAQGGNTVPVSQGNALPAGSYTSFEPLNQLVGCDLNGDWTLTITDNFAIDNGFIFDWGLSFSSATNNDSTAVVNEPGPITLTSTTTDASCGVCNGSATVTPNGGTAPYTYLWNNGETSATINDQCAGVYEVEVTDDNGCFATFYVAISNDDGPTGATTNITDASCFGACDGAADVTPIGGTPPYVYQWVPGGFTTPAVTGLCAGTYYAQIQDSVGCIHTETIVIGEPAQIEVGQAVTNSTCGNSDGQIILSPLTGTPPYSYSWTPNVSSSFIATGLAAGVYGVTVTDGTGCTEVITVLLDDFPAPNVTGFGTDPLCNADCNGEAWLTTLGGNPPFVYSWDDPSNQTTDTAVGLCAGLYTVTVTDSLGCVATAQVTLDEPDPISLSILIVNNSTCSGNCDGSITAIPTGGTLPFTYQWNDPLNQTGETASGLCAGTYEVLVTDANGCTELISGTVEDPTGLTASIFSQDAQCAGVCDGLAWVEVSGGTPPYTYSWDDPSNQTTDTAFALCVGTYNVTITDGNGCQFFLSATIDEPSGIVVSIGNVVNLQCDGECIGEAEASATGGTGPYTFQWDDALLQNTALADSLCASTYTVTVTDANGCTATEQVSITGPGGLTASISNQVNTTCNGDCDGEATVAVVGGTPPYTYQWNDPLNQTTATADSLCAGTYSVVVTDDNGCISVTVVVITQPNVLTASTTATDASCFGECDGTATAFATGGTFPYSYSWNDPLNQTTLMATGLCPGNYEVTITGTNACTTVATVTIFEPTEITIDTIVVNAACGLCDGSITLLPDGGVPAYTYVWGNTGETTATVSNLCPGIHTVDITDAIGCTQNFDIAISNDGGITSATVVTTDATCFGSCDGSATVTPDDGIAPFTYLWVPGGQTTSSVTGLCAGDYNVQVVDSNGCIFTQLVQIGEPNEIVGNYNATSATCGQCDGAITLAPTGGDGGPYTYVWNPNVSTSDTATGLCPDAYSVTITDNSGCSTVEVIPVNNISGPVLSTSTVDVLCNGDCNGSATVVISGGTGPFNILWSDPLAQTTATANGLCAGTYTVEVTDANGCITNAVVVVDEPDPISLSLQLVVNASCNGACDGSATIIASGGTLPYTFNWSPAGGSGPTAVDLCAGVYTVLVTGANGCTESVTVTINEPPAIIIATDSQDASCNGVCDGEAYASASGGTPPFSYFWPIPGSNNDTITGLCAGTYTVIVTDGSGCIDSTQVNVLEPDSIGIATTATGVSCFGDCDGVAMATPTGGTAPYTYQWNDPLSQTTAEADSLCPGTYIVLVTDSNGCFNTASVIITEPLELALTDSVINVSCGGECDGVAGVIPFGGTPGYTYAWNDPNNSTTQFVTNLCAGIYSVVVTDANGCSDSITVTITEPPQLFGPVTQTDVSCGGQCDGSLTVLPSGGTPPYAINWTPGNFTTPTIADLCAGEYILTLTDTNGCSVVDTFNITEPPVLSSSITNTVHVLCDNACTGEATVTPVGGTPPYTYFWTPGGQTGQTATGLCVGTYDVIVTDSIGCADTSQVVINDDNVLVVSVPISTDVSCTGDCDGTATAVVSGGVGPFNYLWNDQFNQATETATGLCAGTYIVTVTDSQNPPCVATATVIIDEPTQLSVQVTGTDVSCGGLCDGTALAVPSGGTPGYTYLWNDPNGQTVADPSGLCVGTYTVTVTDANECTVQGSVTISGPLPINSNATSTASSCSNETDGSIDLTVVGGNTPYTYSWDPGGAITQDLTNVASGTYTVTIIDADGCEHTATYQIGTLVQIAADAGLDMTICLNEFLELDGSGGDFYSWTPADSVDNPNIFNPQVLATDTITYYLTVTVGTCEAVDSVVVNINPPPVLDAGEDEQILQGGSVNLNANGIVTGWTYEWSPTEFIDNPSISNPNVTPEETTMFYVTVTDDNGCTTTDSVLVEVLPSIVFPDGITPNGDGINDTWIIDNISNYADAVVEVYNRWGQQLYVSEPGYPVPWDGRYKGKDLPVGTYYFVIHATDLEEAFTGPITIVR